MYIPTAFPIRPAAVRKNADFIIYIFDSVIRRLIAAGNAGLWGTELFSTKNGFLDSTRNDPMQSEHFRTTGRGERICTFVADRGELQVPFAFITIREGHFPQHGSSVDALKPYVHVAKSLPGGYCNNDEQTSACRKTSAEERTLHQ
jgi:hypothetical protein